MAQPKPSDIIDPLTPATRATKRNLLAVSMAAVIYKAFDITADKISVFGLNISFDRGLFGFLLLVMLTYFFVCFILYYYIDIRNRRRLQHELETESWLSQRVAALTHGYWQEGTVRIHELRSGLHCNVDQEYYATLGKWTLGYPTVLRLIWRMKKSPVPTKELISVYGSTTPARTPDNSRIFTAAEKEETLQEAIKLIDAHTRRFPLRYLRMKLLNLPRLWTVRAAYFLRNYAIDGLLPVLLAVIGVAALFEIIDLHFLKSLAPP